MERNVLLQNELVLSEKKEVNGIKFNQVYGGFGKNEKCILAKDIANIHEKAVYRINEAINNNIKHFDDFVDIINLKETEFANDLIENGIYSQNSLNASKYVYLLSQRGYLKLVKILEDAKAWEVYNLLLNEYFLLKEEKEESLAKIDSEFLFQLAMTMEEKERQIKELKPKAHAWEKLVAQGKCVTIQTAAQAFNIKGLGRNNMFKLLRRKNILQKNNKPYQRYINCGRFKSKIIDNGFTSSITLITPKGLEWLASKLTEWGYLEPSETIKEIAAAEPVQLELV